MEASFPASYFERLRTLLFGKGNLRCEALPGMRHQPEPPEPMRLPGLEKVRANGFTGQGQFNA